METLKIFGERLRALRDERHLRQADMAEVLQITLVHYQRMEYGKVNVPSLTLCFLADYFSVTTDYLLGLNNRRFICVDNLSTLQEEALRRLVDVMDIPMRE